MFRWRHGRRSSTVSAAGRHERLVELLFGAYRRQVRALLLLRPDESFYVREIGRRTACLRGSLNPFAAVAKMIEEVKAAAVPGGVSKSRAARSGPG